MAEAIQGGCFCGAVRYEISGEPELQLYCFCHDCLSTFGTDGYAGYMVKDERFRKTKGVTSAFEKTSAEGRKVTRHFCGKCGSSLWGETELGITSVAAGSLDDPSVFKPTMNVFEEQAPLWARIPEHSEQR